MPKQCLRFLMALAAVVSCAVLTRAQAPDKIVVDIPFSFVMMDRTFPAGTYDVKRNTQTTLILSSLENGVNTIVLPAWRENHLATGGRISFERIGSQYFLVAIQTPHNVFAIPLSRSAVLLAFRESTALVTADARTH